MPPAQQALKLLAQGLLKAFLRPHTLVASGLLKAAYTSSLRHLGVVHARRRHVAVALNVPLILRQHRNGFNCRHILSEVVEDVREGLAPEKKKK